MMVMVSWFIKIFNYPIRCDVMFVSTWTLVSEHLFSKFSSLRACQSANMIRADYQSLIF